MPLVTVTTFRYSPWARFNAFANMGRFLIRPFKAKGLRFQKLLGSGQNFGLIPNFSIYVFLGVWDSQDSVQVFLRSDDYRRLSKGSTQVSTLYLQPVRSHGLWDGQNPFTNGSEHTIDSSKGATTMDGQNDKQLIAVLTRATIRPGALIDFWKHVPRARQRLNDHRDDLLFGIGVGEVPLVQQCTISVWRDPAAVERYAYRQSGHKEVVRLTRQRKWYSEELFARFNVLKVDGDLFRDSL